MKYADDHDQNELGSVEHEIEPHRAYKSFFLKGSLLTDAIKGTACHDLESAFLLEPVLEAHHPYEDYLVGEGQAAEAKENYRKLLGVTKVLIERL